MDGCAGRSLVLALVPAKAEAGFCGVARYSCCAPCCQMQCHTVMKTVRCIEYEQQAVHLLQNVLGPSLRRSGHQLREVRSRDPHPREFATRSASRVGNEDALLHGVQAVLGNQDPRDLLHGLQAVLGNQDALLHGVQAVLGKPQQGSLLHGLQAVWETKTRCYTVCKPCWETKTRTLHGLQAVLGNQDPRRSATRSASRAGKTSTRCYTVCKPCWETKTREICYNVRCR